MRNIPQDQKWDERFVGKIIEKYSALTVLSAAEKPDLIIWPETSVPGFIENEKILLEWVKGLAKLADVPLLVGARSTLRRRRWKSSSGARLP